MIFLDMLAGLTLFSAVLSGIRMKALWPAGIFGIKPSTHAILENMQMCSDDWQRDNAGTYYNKKIGIKIMVDKLTWREYRLLNAAIENMSAKRITEKTYARVLED